MDSDNPKTFGLKTEDWLSAQDLYDQGFIGADTKKIRIALRQLQGTMPEHIQMMRGQNRPGICLFNDPAVIQQFCKLAGFSTLIKKTAGRWLNAKDLENTHICATADVIRGALEKLQSEMPKYIRVIDMNPAGRRVFYLLNNQLVIHNFCARANLVQPVEVEKLGEWLTIGELCEKIHCNPLVLLKVVRESQSAMSEDIRPQTMLCIRNDDHVIDALRKKIACAEPEIPKKDDFNAVDWVSVAGLIEKKHMPNSRKDIIVALKEWQKTSSQDVCEKPYGKKTTLYLRNDKDVIDRFRKFYGSLRQKKDEDWLSVLGLLKNGGVTGTYKKIEEALQRWQVNNPNDIMSKARGKGVSYYLRNNQDVISRFSESLVQTEWISAFRLMKQKYVRGAPKKIAEALKEWQTTNPDDIQQRTFKGETVLYLRNDPDVIKRFKESLEQKNWLTVSGLMEKNLVRGGHDKVAAALKEWQKTNPDDVQQRTFRGETILCLRNDPDVIKGFKEAVGKQKPKPKPDATVEWLSAKDLEYRYIDAGYLAISDKLFMLQPHMPDLIQHKDTPDGPKLCLKRAAIQSVCDKAGFDAITPKTSEWLSIKELEQDYVPRPWPHQKVRDVLLRNKPYKCEYIKTKINDTGRLILCLWNTPEAITWFRKKMELSPMLFPDEKDKWISIDDLAEKYILATKDEIISRLNEIAHCIRSDIWEARSDGHIVTYLRRGAMEDICKMTRLKTKAKVFAEVATVSSLASSTIAQSKQKS